MRLAVDVMGGDHGSAVVIEAVRRVLHAERDWAKIFLVGPQDDIQSQLRACKISDPRLEVVHASEHLTMDDKPAAAVRRKRDASIVKAMDLVRHKNADGVLSLGNTGGIFAASAFRLGRLRGVDRGGIATVIPTPNSQFVLLDGGANIECDPIHLVHYAIMGSVYSRDVLGVVSPRVGVLSIGTEEGKGNELTLEAVRLCRRVDLNFIGNVEGHGLFQDRVDVVVCDGFVGNVVLKTCESLATAMFGFMKRELTRSLRRQLGALLAQNAFRAIKRKLDPEVYGGAPMLGFRGNVMKAHGSAREKAIVSAIRVAKFNIQHHVSETIERAIAQANEQLGAAVAASATS